MIKTVYGGQAIWVLNIEPDWEDGVSADISVVAQKETGLSNREGRRAFSQSLRFNTKFRLTADGAEARRLAGGIMELSVEPVLLPLWSAAMMWRERATRTIAGGLYVVFKDDWSRFELYENVEPGWPGDFDWVAPVLWGRLDGPGGRPALEWLSPENAQCDVDHVETGPVKYAIVPAPGVYADGPVPSNAYGGAGFPIPKLIPFEVNFTSVTERFSLAILREQIGFGREPAQTFYPQASARETESDFFLERAELGAALLEFFRQHAGGRAFWASDWISAAVLTRDIDIWDTVLHVSDSAGVAVGDWVSFNHEGVVATARVVDKGPYSLVVDHAPGKLSASDTVIAKLLLVRFAKPQLSVQWHCREYAEARLSLRELPAEYTPADDETLGDSLGVLRTRCFFYEFSRTLNGVVFTERVSSFEQDLVYGGNPYAGKKVGHGDIKQGMYLEADEVEIKADVGAVTTLDLMGKLRMEVPLYVKVIAADVADDLTVSNAQDLFVGEIVRVSVKGSRLTGKAVTGRGVFDRNVPGFLFQPMCNYGVFSVGCGMDPADWKCSALVKDPGATGYPYEFVLKNLVGVGANAIAALGAGDVVDNWFALGWIEFGAGANWQARAVLLSTAPEGGILTVTLDRDPYPYPAIGDAVVLFPGCDQQPATCKVKFDNYLNFGGHPLMPLGNPSVVRKNPTGSGGKK